MKKISVIVPVYNTEEYIEKCINSITGQTYKNLEIIVVNDGSTDNSLNILKSLQSKDSRIRIINQENKGVSAARNTGLDNTTGEYIAFVDSDDYLEKNMYEKMLKYMGESGADLVSARAFIIERSNKPGENDYNNYIDTFTSQAQILKAYADGFLTIAQTTNGYCLIEPQQLLANNCYEVVGQLYGGRKLSLIELRDILTEQKNKMS